MKAHIVLAHPEPKSFNAHLANIAQQTLAERGWAVSSSDLYAMAFDPCEKATHYEDRLDIERFDTQAEQRHASKNDTIPSEIQSEIARLDEADLVIFQYPMWWHLPPAILKGWFDRVMVYGEVYRSTYRFDKGRFVGKRALLSLTVGTSPETYAYGGRLLKSFYLELSKTSTRRLANNVDNNNISCESHNVSILIELLF